MATKQTETFKVTEADFATGEVITRDITEEELVALQTLRASEASKEAEASAKVAARQSALAKLKELGLTEAEIAAL